MPLNPSPQRQTVVSFPTPNVLDILFFESVDAERIGFEVPEYGTKHPDFNKWPDHRLVHVETTDEQNRYYRFYYASDNLEQDDDNWEYTQADIGGTKFDAVSREYITRRSEFNPDDLTMGDAMPDIPEGKFNGVYVLAERRQVPIDNKVLNGLYIVEKRTYVKKVPLYRLDYDEFFSTTNYTKQELFYATEIPAGGGGLTMAALVADRDNAYWGLSTNGILKTSQQLSDNWYAITTQQVVNTNETGEAGFIRFTTLNYSFPPVLGDIEVDDWELRSGGGRNYPRPVYSKGAFRGPCRAQIATTWTAVQSGAVTLSELPRPESISVSSPFFSVGIPPTLHGYVVINVDNGSEDETFKQTIAVYEAAATNLTTWSAGQAFVISQNQKQFRGGWISEVVTVFAPN